MAKKMARREPGQKSKLAEMENAILRDPAQQFRENKSENPDAFELERWQVAIAKAADRDDGLEAFCQACRDMATRLPIGDGRRETIKRRLWGAAERHLLPRFDIEAIDRVFINAFPEGLAAADGWPAIFYWLGEAMADQQATIRELRQQVAERDRKIEGYRRLMRGSSKQGAAA